MNPMSGTTTSSDTSPERHPSPTAASADAAKSQRPAALKSTATADPSLPRWPVSPRLKSPPPSQQPSRRSSASSKNSDMAENKGRVSGNSSSEEGPSVPPTPSKIPRATAGMNSTLETVQEGDLSSPREESLAELVAQPKKSTDQTKEPLPAIQESGQTPDTEPAKLDLSKPDALRQASAPAAVPTKSTTTPNPNPPPSVKPRTSEPSGQKMQVETETVNSIPQASTASGNERPGPSRSDASGTLKAKPSSETIRPRRDKKKTTKKPPSIVSGPTTTKADIFEAKVASEIEGDDTDSDETFVYESEVPERRRRGRNHSRTPSTTSVTSGNDRKSGVKSINSVLDSHRVRAKRSMKFASNCYPPSSGVDDESGDREFSGVASRRDGPHTHIGLWGKSLANNDDASSHSHSNKMRINTVAHSRHSSRVQSPRSATNLKTGDGFDYESGTGENERTPLMGSMRTPRARGTPRRIPMHVRRIDIYEEPKRNWLSKIAGCMIIFTMVLLVLLGIAGFLFTSTKELEEVRVMEIENVLASQQELMLDIKVEAINPNLASIAVNSVDLQFFAKACPDDGWFWRKRPAPPQRSHRRDAALASAATLDQISTRGWFPPGWEDPDESYLFLGRVYKLSSALKYGGSPFRHSPANSTGELRLSTPGRLVDKDGPAHWKQMIKEPFQLIFKGEIKYQLPLNSRPVTAIIKAGVVVHPEEALDNAGSMRVEPIEMQG